MSLSNTLDYRTWPHRHVAAGKISLFTVRQVIIRNDGTRFGYPNSVVIAKELQIRLLADSGDNAINVNDKFGIRHRLRPSPAGIIRFAKPHLYALKPLCFPILGNNFYWSRQIVKFNAFMLGFLYFPGQRRHLFPGSPVNDKGLFT